MGCEARESEVEGSCEVALLRDDQFVRSVVGPTPIDAPFLSSDLAAQLLDELPDQMMPGSTIRLTYRASFFTFSWELRASVVARLAKIGARVEFAVNRDDPDPAEFDVVKTAVELRVWTDRDPDELTKHLGVEPSDLGRVGEPMRGNRVRDCGFWRASIEREGFPDLDALASSFCGQFAAGTAAVCGEDTAKLGIVLSIVYGDGGFVLEPETIARVAALGLPLGCWLYPSSRP